MKTSTGNDGSNDDDGGPRSLVKAKETHRTFLDKAYEEVLRARKKFPSSEGSVAALMEEVGELSQAMMEKPWDEVVAEALQVAAMACRVAIEGDPSLDNVRKQRVK